MSHYESSRPYHTERMHAVAVYCSDGRVCEQSDEFLRQRLNLSRYDRIAVPGGPGSLVGHAKARLGHVDLLADLELLVTGHAIDRVVLIQHEDCAFYRVRLGVDEPSLEQTQKDDLARAARMIEQTVNVHEIDGYFARRTEAGVIFEPVDLQR